WERNPDPAYLAATGIPRDEMTSHDGTIARAEALGWSCIDSLKASIDEWDHYENLYRDGIEQYIAAHPDDPDTPAMRDRIRHWHNAYLTWGRGTLGFGVYLLRL
ncbi:MAG: class I SAM-dependent methyltransferase, partial [bacterium]